MYIKYKDNIGKLIYYSLSNEGKVQVIMDIPEEPNIKRINFTCQELDITIPNVMGNARILYELNKEGGEDERL